METIKRGDRLPFGEPRAASASREHPAQLLPAGIVERTIGKPPSAWTESDLVDFVFDQGIRLIGLMHVGGDGWLKTLDFVPRGLSHLKDILSGGERADGSSLFKGLGIRSGASDVTLRPRLDTAFLDPFASEPTLVFLCGHRGRDGETLPQSPSGIVRRAQERLRAETGLELHALGEIEYFLGKRKAEGDIYGSHDRGYHATSPFVFGESLRRKAMVVLSEIGVPIKYGHAEVGYIEARDDDPVIWEQHEIELSLAPLQQAASAVVLTQWVLRNLAHRAGMMVSFAPVVREGHAGNGLHFHLAPSSAGKYLDAHEGEDRLRAEAKWLIGGLVEMGGALMAFGNREETSFLRLRQGKEAPRAFTWGSYDRRALIRLPIIPKGADGRQIAPETVEFRLPDGSAQPYFLLAGIAQAMLLGRASKDLDATIEAASATRAAEERRDAKPVPQSAAEIAEALASRRGALEAGGVFPPELIDGVLARLR